MSVTYYLNTEGQRSVLATVDDWQTPQFDAMYVAQYGDLPSTDPGGGRHIAQGSVWVERQPPWIKLVWSASPTQDAPEQSMPPDVTSGLFASSLEGATPSPGPTILGGAGPVTITSTGTASSPSSTAVSGAVPSTGAGLGTFAAVAVVALGVAWAAGWLK